MTRYALAFVALLAAGCGAPPSSPSPVYRAVLTASAPIVGACVDVLCAYTAVITNAGPDCAQSPAVALLVVRLPPLVGVAADQAVAVGVSTTGVLKPNQSVTVAGHDWPVNGALVGSARAAGVAMACP